MEEGSGPEPRDGGENIFYDIDALSAEEIWMVGESRNNSDLIYEARAMHCC